MGTDFIEEINNGYTDKIGRGDALQEMYELQRSKNGFWEPTLLIDNLAALINRLGVDNEEFEQDSPRIFKHKAKVSLKQLFALYAINKITTIANKRGK